MRREVSLVSLSVLLFTSLLSADEFPRRPEDIDVKPLNFSPPSVKEEHLQNGATLFLLPDSETPLIKLFIIFRGGSMTDPPDKLGLSAFSVEMLKSGGCASLSADELDERLDSLGAYFSFNSSTEHITFSLSALPEEFENASRLLFDILTKPKFDSEALKSRKAVFIENLKRVYENSANIATLLFKRALYSNSAFANPVDGLPDTISKIEREDLVSWHKKWLRPKNAFIGLTGPVNESSIAFVKELFGKWSAEGEGEKIPDVKAEEKTGMRIILYERKGLEQTVVLVGALSAERTHPERPSLDFLEYLLLTRVNLKVRNEYGLAYSAYATYQPCSKAGIFYAGAQTKTETAVESLRLMVEQLRIAKTAFPSEDAMRCAKEHFVNSFVFRFAEKERALEELVWLKFYGFADDYLLKYCDRVRNFTPDVIVDAAAKFINTDALVAVLVGEVSSLKNDLKKSFPSAKIQEVSSLFDVNECESNKKK
ncbi:MAG: insulinase family protein [Planctomycetota bacterium]|nr:insulinase family protein [Planctomycetota bacterium]